MTKIASLIAVLMLAFAATSGASPRLYVDPGTGFASPAPHAQGAGVQDLRSPDARTPFTAPRVVTPDARSPFESPAQDLRSPDAGDSGRFTIHAPAAAPDNSAGGDFEWGYLAIALVGALALLTAVLTATQRRKRHTVVSSS